MSPTPAITVLVASYNYERYLSEALESALDQSWRDFELLVVDDGSSDGSLALAKGFAVRDARVRVLQHPDEKNHGLPATLALGLAEARGTHIAFLESDDIWHPHCLRQRMEALERSGAGVVFNDIAPLSMPGSNTTWFDGYVPRVMAEHARLAANQGNAYSPGAAFLTENKIPTFSCAMVRADLLRGCSLHAPVPRWSDWWIWTQLAQETTFAFVPLKLTHWRLHRASLNHGISPVAYLRDYRAMWNGFRRRLTSQPQKNTAAALLRLPYWAGIFARFHTIVRQYGVKDTLRRVLFRFGLFGASGRAPRKERPVHLTHQGFPAGKQSPKALH